MKNKNRQVIIHIGMPKTGSTSIQHTFHKIRGVMRHGSASLYYLPMPSPNHGKYIRSFFSADASMVPLNSKLGLSKDELEAFNRETETLLDKALQWHCNSNVLISGEGIGFMDESDLLGLRDYLSAYFDSVRIVCYVRTPISYMQSAFQERVKGRLGSFHADELYKSYKKRFEKIESVFGESSCDFWKFDPKAFRSSDVVLDFCDRLNIELGQVEINRVNDSLSLNALKLLFAYKINTCL